MFMAIKKKKKQQNNTKKQKKKPHGNHKCKYFHFTVIIN